MNERGMGIKMKRKLKICICCSALLLSGCITKSKSDIESHVIHIVDNYATPDLFSFFNKYSRDIELPEEINDDDLGAWQLYSSITRDEGNTSIHEGMRLFVNFNTQKITGTYFYNSYVLSDDVRQEVNQTYQLYYDREGYHLIDEVADETLKQRILNFKFAFQYIDLDPNVVKTYKVEDSKYSPKPSKYYNMSYKFEDESALKKLKKEQPYINDTTNTLLLLNDDYRGQELVFQFNDKQNTELSESITFGATEEFEVLRQEFSPGITNALQRLYALYPTKDISTLLTTKAALNDHTKGKWVIHNECFINDLSQGIKEFTVNKELGEVSGEYIDDSCFPIEYSIEGYKPVGKGNEKYKDKINKSKLLIEMLDIDFESLPKPENGNSYYDFEKIYTLSKSDPLFLNLQKVFPDIDGTSEILFTVTLSRYTNLTYALGSPALKVEYTSSSGDKIKITESLKYYPNYRNMIFE